MKKIILIVMGCFSFVLAPGAFSPALNAADLDQVPTVGLNVDDGFDVDDAQEGDDEVRETFADDGSFETTQLGEGDFERRRPKCKCSNCPRGMRCHVTTDGPNCTATCRERVR